MDLVSLIIQLAVVGLVVYLIVTYIPMPDVFKKGILIVAAVAVLIYLLNVLGLMGEVHSIRIGPVR